jgi:hypothetical protein
MSLRKKVKQPGVVKAAVFRRGTVQLVGGMLTVCFLEICGYPGILFGGGGGVFQQILVRTEGRENEDLRAVAP